MLNLSELVAETDRRLLVMLGLLAFLLTLLAWKLVEGLAAAVSTVVYSLTPKGRLDEKQRREAMQAQVDAIMAKIKSGPALCPGPPKPPSAWQVALKRLAPLAYVVVMGAWGCGALHFFQSAAATAARIAEEEARNPRLVSSLRGLNNDEPGRAYAVAVFLACQLLALILGSAWQWYKSYRVADQTMPGPHQNV